MSDKQDKIHCYPSPRGDSRWVTATQYLAELMCIRRAKADKKELPHLFFKTKPWDAIYRFQVASANRIVKLLDPEKTGSGAKALSRFLKSERGKNAYSLAGKWIMPFVEAIHRELLNEQPKKELQPIVTEIPFEKPRVAFAEKQSLISKI